MAVLGGGAPVAPQKRHRDESSLGYSTEPRFSMGKKIKSNIEMPGEQAW
jgi:hypothetical protein